MTAAGLPDFGPVQNNMSFNDAVGTTRGIHAEPWDKWVSVATGRIFGAWVDLREGPDVRRRLHDGDRPLARDLRAARRRQRLPDARARHRLHYLVNDHWSPDAEYTFLNLADETVAIDMADPARRGGDLAEGPRASAPRRCRADAAPQDARPRRERPARPRAARGVRRCHARRVRRRGTTSTSPRPISRLPAVGATTARSSMQRRTRRSISPRRPTGRADAWAANVAGVTALARGRDGERHHPRPRVERLRVRRDGRPPLLARTIRSRRSASTARPRRPATPSSRRSPRHYIVRTSWVIGDGKNFVRDDGVARRARHRSEGGGRPDRPPDIHERHRARHPSSARVGAPYGVYNLTGSRGARSRGRTSRGASSTLTGHDPGSGHGGHDRRVLRDGHRTGRAATSQQRARPREDRGDGIHPSRSS